MSEPVLERSVLERKERDELQTIARALGAEPPARMKKADLVDLVLRSAGIAPEEGTAPPAPTPPATRTRGRAAAARAAEVVADVEADQVAAVEPPVVPATEEATDVDGGADRSAQGSPDGGDTAAGEAPDGGAAAGAPSDAGQDPATVTGSRIGQRPRGGVPGGTPPEERQRSQAQPTRPQGDRDGAGLPDRVAGGRDDGDRERTQGSEPDRGRSDRDRERARGDQPDRSRSERERAQGDQPDRDTGQADRDRKRAQGDRQERNPNRSDRDVHRTDADRERAQGDQPTDGNQPDRDRNQGNQTGPARSGQQGQAGQAGPGNQQVQGPQQGGVQAGEEEGGNRRRRRRNRDRPDGPAERPEGDESFLGEPVECAGLLDLRDEGYGFLRVKGYLPHRDDVYVSVRQVRQLGLRKGDHLSGASRPANRQEKNPALLRIDQVNGQDPEASRRRPRFEDLTPLFPDERLRLESSSDPTNMTARIVDLISPIGKGQRGLIVSPPKAGKTTILKQIVKSIERNDPTVHLMVLLVDERPEEVTDMRRSTQGEVIASTFDRPSEEHTAVSELVIERAKRLVEEGRDVVIVLDGITRLARAYNLAAPATGRIMSGGIDTGALYPPKKFFGAARNIEEGGSLTILATALIETGSKMDEVIFEEFKGTGNMELRLDRRLAERRIYPAIDVDASSTRHEELLFSRSQLQQVWRVRRALHALSSDAGSPAAALERLMDGMKTFRTNDEFLAEAAKAGGPAT